MTKNLLSRISSITAALFMMTLVGLGWTASPATAAPNVVQATLWASPTGSGSICSSSSPCSLIAARDKVRTMNTNMTGDIVVTLMGGTYALTSTLELTESATTHDSGSNGFDVIYRNAPGGVPVLSGGTPVTGFTLFDAAKNIYRAPVAPDLETRQLYVDGVRATRARSSGNPGFALSAGGYTVPATGPYANLANWGNVGDLEVAATFHWKQARYSVASVSGSAMTMDAAGWSDGNTQPGTAARQMAWIENAYELLDTPGEWYLDRTTDWVYYLPLTGQNMSTAQVVAGSTTGLLTATGATATPIHNLVIDGLTFSYDSWTVPSTPLGYPDFQAGAVYRGSGDWWNNSTMTPSAVTFSAARNVVVRNNTFTHLANGALAFGAGSVENLVDHNSFSDVSGNGISLGGIDIADHHPTDSARITRDNTISNNTITKIGVEYADNVGIFLGYTQGSDVRNNTLFDLPYTGISMGWGWGYIDTMGVPVAKNNVIRGNLIHDYMQSRDDGGAIYTLGSQMGSQVVDNYMYGAKVPYGGLYRDNGSAGFADLNNVVSRQDSTINSWCLINVSAGGYWNAHDNSVQGNYFTSGMTASGGGGSNVVTGNTSVSGSWPAGAQAVIDNAGVGGAPITPVTVGEVPLSQSKVASSSSVYSSAYTADKAVDGDPNTRWAQGSGLPDPSWLSVDLGAPFEISRTATRAYLHAGAGMKYRIEYSLNGTSWSTFADRTASFVVPSSDSNAARPLARYLRITLLATQGQGGSLYEFKVYGSPPPPVSQGKPTSSSSSYSAAYTADKAVDGDLASRWAQGSGLPDPSWLEVDLGAATSIGRVETTAYLPSGAGWKYRLEYSTDHTTWFTYADHSSTYDVPGTDMAGPVSARYVRLAILATQGQGGSVYEFRIYGA